ncbi:MAG TPA: bifunctional adenosylcobinamide kinase/adenosylcobinamide-phosphate guanylyltransferase [Mycobacteriales bacterium]|nr:bifunctional adenosylcobinamide kinase/adenosylcobinamide-phosphate guanylyltransferase [Mycobacteriales bacterium]
MRVEVLGSGASDGWPNPWCTCASCTGAREQGVLRHQSSVLVDGRLLIDIGPTAGTHDLRAVEAVLVTHHHVDHHFPPAWAWRAWAQHAGPLTVLAPPSVLAHARFDDSVRTVAALPGEVHEVLGYTVRVLEATHTKDAVLFDVTAPDGGSLLYACDTGALPEETVRAVAGRSFDVVLLELAGVPMPTHLTLETWPAQVDRLRRAGAVTGATALLATHLGHANPPPDELDRRLVALGATAARDGQVIGTGHDRGHRVLVIGGQSSGKSAHAESLVHGEVTYVATAPPRDDDAEWQRRVEVHAARRPVHWVTLETADLPQVLRQEGGPLLIDDLGLWLTQVLDGHWDSTSAREVFSVALQELRTAWEATRREVVLVAPEVGSGVVPAHASGRLFADLLGRATTELAGCADQVVQVVAGQARRLR